MILWLKHLPLIRMNLKEWNPFIQSDWFRTHFMKFVYVLQITSFLLPFVLRTNFAPFSTITLVAIALVVFISHEFFHMLVIHSKGDVSLTFQGTFFWIHTNEILSKARFWLFMSLPFIALTVVPAMISFFVAGTLQTVVLFISWINLCYSAADIINSILIGVKPKNAVFCSGYYRVERN